MWLGCVPCHDAGPGGTSVFAPRPRLQVQPGELCRTLDVPGEHPAQPPFKQRVQGSGVSAAVERGQPNGALPGVNTDVAVRSPFTSAWWSCCGGSSCLAGTAHHALR
jgi:hypothetical protein